MKMLKRRTFRSIATVFVALSAMTVSTVNADAGLLGPSSDYIVRITPATQVAVESAIKNAGGTVNQRFQYAMSGFVIKLPDILIPVLKKIPNVLTVEKDMPVSGLDIQQNESPTPSWGLDRIDQREPLSTASGYQGNYVYRSAGAGATIYIGDTGVYPSDDLAGRLSTVGFSGISDGNGTTDCNGHGTHVATTSAGTKYGVAKSAKVVPVRILDCTGRGSYATVIAGLDWILSPMNTNSKSQAVLNLSIGGAASSSINDAVLKLTNAGITVVAAAGNDNIDACLASPASAPSAITVGAVTSGDTKAGFSNWGSCVDINAPGVGITAGWMGSPTATNTISGTSMATPHVTGAAAVYLGLNPGASVAQVADGLTSQATTGVLLGLTGVTPNKLLYVSPTDGGPAIVPPAVLVQSVSTVTHESASVAVEINPNNAPTTASFEYSTDQSFAAGVVTKNLTPSAALVGGDVISIPLTLDSLTASSTYYFRATAKNESGSFTTPVGSFKTPAPPVRAPSVVATAPTNVTGWSAHLNGTVNANNGTSTIYFLWGTDSTFATNTLTVAASPATVSGSSVISVGLDVSFLNPTTTYYYKVLAGNSVAQTVSNVTSFTTPALVGVAPTVETIRPTGGLNTPVTTITGKVNPQGQTTSIRLVYGTESSFTVAQRIVDLPTKYTGVDTVTVTADMTGLVPGYRYYYRFEAINAAGITKVTPLTNVGNPVAPVINSTTASLQTLNSIQFNANVNAGAGNLRYYFVYGTDPNLETGTTTVQANPFAIANALNTNISAAITGLTPGTAYYFRVRMFAYTGPLAEAGGLGFGPIVKTATLYPPRLSQTITFNLPASRYYGGGATPLTATSSAGLPITYTTTSTNICQVQYVDNQPVLNYVSPVSAASSIGCTVTASQDGDSTYAPATSVARAINWVKDSTVIRTTWSGALNETGTALDLVVASLSQPTLNENVTGTAPLTVISRTPNICAVDSATYLGQGGVHTRAIIHSLWNGSCQLAVSFAGYSYWLPTSLTFNTTVSGMTTPLAGANAAQAINFTTPANREPGTPNPLVVTATSGLPVTLTVLTPAVCSVTKAVDGTFAAVAADGLTGDSVCTIQADQTGDSRWAAAAPVTRSFTWVRKAQSITFNLAASRFYGGAPTVLTATSSSGLPVTFTSSTPATCSATTTDSQTVLNYVLPLPVTGNGLCAVIASQSGSGVYAPATSVLRGITFMKESTAITATWGGVLNETGTTLDLFVMSSSQPNLKENLAGTTALVVTSTSKTICSVGTSTYVGSSTVHTRVNVKGLWNGTCSLQVSFAGNSYWLPVTSSVIRAITGMTTPQAGAGAAQTISGSGMANTQYGLLNPISARATSGLPITVTSATPATCSVVTLANGGYAASAADGLTGDLNTCSLRISQAGNDAWAPAPTITTSFKWLRKAQTVTFSLPAPRYYGGAATVLTGTATSGLAVSYTTLTPTICAINVGETNTVVNYLSPISTASSAVCYITASQAGDGVWAPATGVTRTLTYMKEPTTIQTTLSAPVSITGSTLDIRLISSVQSSLGELNGGTAPLTVTTLTPKVCSVANPTFIGTSASHTRVTVSALWNGSCQLRVVFAGNTYWLPSTSTYTVAVTGVLTPQPGAGLGQIINSFATIANREYGPAAPLTATATSGLPVTFTSLTPATCVILQPSNGSYVVQSAPGVSGNGVLCTVQANQAGNDAWAAAAPVTRSFTWNKVATVIRVTNGVSTRTSAGPFQLLASALAVNPALNSNLQSLGLPVVVTTSTPAVCQIISNSQVDNGSGIFTQATIKGLANGTCTTSWAFAGNDTRLAATTAYSFSFTGIK
jgi:subtilisin family serine protease